MGLAKVGCSENAAFKSDCLCGNAVPAGSSSSRNCQDEFLVDKMVPSGKCTKTSIAVYTGLGEESKEKVQKNPIAKIEFKDGRKEAGFFDFKKWCNDN